MNAALWICQGLLAAIFLVSGTAKISQSRERLLATGQTGIAPFPMPVVRLTAFCELLGVVGILPRLTGIAPVLTPMAAIGFGVVMIGAAASHLKLGEPWTALANIAILAVCALVAYGTLTG
ncbi:MAG: DoxX family protein [Streptosporangiales bacterium]|nr:DoxX family protein [Streptosporangiales bacterium]